MRKRLHKRLTRRFGLLSSIAALLGIISCLGCSEYGSGPDEFRYKYRYARIKGVVVSDDNEQPIQGIEVESSHKGFKDLVILSYRLYSDSDGSFEIIIDSYVKDFSEQEGWVLVKFRDIDGEDNGGSFMLNEVNIKIEKEDYKKDFTEGEYPLEKDLGKIRLINWDSIKKASQ